MEKFSATDSFASQIFAASTNGRWMLFSSASAKTRNAGVRSCALTGMIKKSAAIAVAAIDVAAVSGPEAADGCRTVRSRGLDVAPSKRAVRSEVLHSARRGK